MQKAQMLKQSMRPSKQPDHCIQTVFNLRRFYQQRSRTGVLLRFAALRRAVAAADAEAVGTHREYQERSCKESFEKPQQWCDWNSKVGRAKKQQTKEPLKPYEFMR